MGDDPSTGCVFCLIAKGVMRGRIVASFPLAVAFLPIRPAVLGHTLVIPRQHVTALWNLDAMTNHALSDALVDVAARITHSLKPDGLNVIQSNGEVATQSISHLHWHVVPRADDDGLPGLWPPPRDWDATELDAIAGLLSGVQDVQHGSL